MCLTFLTLRMLPHRPPLLTGPLSSALPLLSLRRRLHPRPRPRPRHPPRPRLPVVESVEIVPLQDQIRVAARVVPWRIR
jgi:hypothetical protein